MKNIFLGLALATLSMACTTSESKASYDDASTPAMECTTEDCEKACCLEELSECSSEKAAECAGEKAAECSSEKKVCPVTGQEIN